MTIPRRRPVPATSLAVEGLLIASVPVLPMEETELNSTVNQRTRLVADLLRGTGATVPCIHLLLAARRKLWPGVGASPLEEAVRQRAGVPAADVRAYLDGANDLLDAFDRPDRTTILSAHLATCLEFDRPSSWWSLALAVDGGARPISLDWTPDGPKWGWPVPVWS